MVHVLMNGFVVYGGYESCKAEGIDQAKLGVRIEGFDDDHGVETRQHRAGVT